jgi:hypothetical protein
MIFACLTGSGFAQADSTLKNMPDTLIVGKFIIIKKNKPGSNNSYDSTNTHTIHIDFGNHHKNKKQSNISTNWLIFDLGFANYTDNTNYTTANQSSYFNGATFSKEDFRLHTTKSSNVNIWFFMQKLNITKHVLNLKYGLGLSMYNFRYENNISYHNNPAYVYTDSVNFSKDKLYAGYLTVPFMLNINTSPHSHKGFSFSAGVSAGYLVGSHTKQISDERGKQKVHGDFDLNPWRFAYVAELGLGPVRLYGSYSINALHSEGLTQYPYTVGFRFSNW